MAYEPRVVPEIEGEIQQAAWYCLDCGRQQHSRQSIEYHWKSVHGEDGETPCETIDIATGLMLVQMRIRREAWIEQQASRFARDMHDGFTPDDFIAEADIRTVGEVPSDV